MTDALRARVQELAEARAVAAKMRAEVSTLESTWRQQPDVVAALKGAEDAARTAAALETEVRAEACKAYAATGSKAPAPGVTIAITKRVVYDAEQVTRWALAKGLCVTLDTKAFEALAKKNVPRDDAGAPLAVLEEVPQARLSSDLGSALGVPSGPPGSWTVRSDSAPGVSYMVSRHEDGTLTCTCPAGAAGKPCKHLARIPGGA